MKGRGRGEDEVEDEGGGQLEGGEWLLVSTQVHNVLFNGFSLFLINPRCACTARVMVLVLSVYLSPCLLPCFLPLRAMKEQIVIQGGLLLQRLHF